MVMTLFALGQILVKSLSFCNFYLVFLGKIFLVWYGAPLRPEGSVQVSGAVSPVTCTSLEISKHKRHLLVSFNNSSGSLDLPNI